MTNKNVFNVIIFSLSILWLIFLYFSSQHFLIIFNNILRYLITFKTIIIIFIIFHVYFDYFDLFVSIMCVHFEQSRQANVHIVKNYGRMALLDHQ
jgi:hypothetical protein